MRIGSLFSGVGGFELGLEWASVGETAFQVELDPFCSSVLAKLWPHVPRFRDVHDVGAHNLPSVDVLCGGFPCQDISLAGRGAGLAGKHSGLWREFARIIREVRPEYVVVENVAALLRRGIDRVLADLALCGYDAEWSRLSAQNVGALHRRQRIFIIAYAEREPLWQLAERDEQLAPERGHDEPRDARSARTAIPDTDCAGRRERRGSVAVQRSISPAQRDGESQCRDAALSDADSERQRVSGLAQSGGVESTWGSEPDRLHSVGRLVHTALDKSYWAAEPNVGRVVDGISALMDCIDGVPIAAAPPIPAKKWKAGRAHRLRALGNAIVPQCAEYVGRRLMQIHAERYSDA